MPRNPSSPQGEKVFLPPGGKMGELIRSMDWSKTPLGPMENWPPTLLTNLATILESPFPHLIYWGRELTILYNDAYIHLLGEKEEALGKCFFGVWPELRDTLEPLIEKAFAGESVYIDSSPFNLIRHGYPEQTWFNFSLSPLRDAHGSVVGLFAIVIETTKRERELREREERFLTMADSLPLIIWVHNIDGKQRFVNRTFNEYFGLSPGEMTPEKWALLTDPESGPPYIEEFLSCVREQRCFNAEVRVRRADSQWRWIESWGRPLYSPSGEYSAFVGTSADITDRNRTEELLSRQTAILSGINRVFVRTITCRTEEELGETCLSVAEELTDSMFGFIGEIGNDGLLHDIAISNPGWEQCTMYDKSGHRRPPGNFRITGLYGSVLKSGTPLFTNTPRDHPDSIGVPEGHPPLSSFVGVPLILGGKTVGILCVGNRRGGYRREDQETLEALAPAVIQAFSRKRAELNLRAEKNAMEQRVQKRTTELEQANRAKDEFLANMSHEIRTPMAGVLGLTEILLHNDLPSQVHGDLDMIRSSANSVMTLINDLFDLSRISQGKFEFHPEEFDLRSMVRNAIGPFEFQARSKDLDFSVTFDVSVPSQILCDKNRLGQVLKNLVSNAIKFTEQGFIRVHVKAEKNDEDTLRLNFAVADSGMGIPKEKQEEVFSAFTQLDPSYSKKFAGMGLGLAISKSLVKGMGGEITVSSAKGKGATFSFYITCAKATEEREPIAPGITLANLQPMTVLLVEDNPVNRLFLRRALVTAGHKVGEAENGKHALTKLKNTHFDLVLMDIQMPEMDGVEATQRIRSGKYGRADIPVIALTAYAMKGDREKFMTKGMDGYVTKPVDFGELARTIAEICGITSIT